LALSRASFAIVVTDLFSVLSHVRDAAVSADDLAASAEFLASILAVYSCPYFAVKDAYRSDEFVVILNLPD